MKARHSELSVEIFTTIITDIPGDKEELLHQKIVFELALKQASIELAR